MSLVNIAFSWVSPGETAARQILFNHNGLSDGTLSRCGTGTPPSTSAIFGTVE
jgi:hypothetical protein